MSPRVSPYSRTSTCPKVTDERLLERQDELATSLTSGASPQQTVARRFMHGLAADRGDDDDVVVVVTVIDVLDSSSFPLLTRDLFSDDLILCSAVISQ